MDRQATQSRPQLVCILADNSPSMTIGDKAAIATQAIRDMIMECQARGPKGRDRSYFRLLLIRFDENARIDIDMRPVRDIDPESVSIQGDGSGTNITAALDCLFTKLVPYMREINQHAERDLHPVPLVLLFSDGEHKLGPSPLPASAKIKQLGLSEDPVIIAAAGLTKDAAFEDAATLSAIATPDCYVDCDPDYLAQWLVDVGSSGLSKPKEIALLMHRAIHQQKQLRDMR